MSRPVVAIALALAACDDALDQRLAIIDGPRVLAVISEPAEARPKAMVTYRAVTASPDGPLVGVPHWAYCTAPKPPTEDNAVPDGCVTGNQLVDLGSSETVTAALPADGCLLYGPDTPPGGFRPRSADDTGGYYQPIRADLDPVLAFGLSRITCKLPTAPATEARRYDLEYVANQNPTIDGAVPAVAGIDRVPADSDVELTLAWTPDSVETYLYFDPGAQVLVDRRESMRVSWFATAGALPVDSTIVGEDDLATQATTTWHTPDPGTAWVWVVLRDSRGGIAVRELEITVE